MSSVGGTARGECGAGRGSSWRRGGCVSNVRDVIRARRRAGSHVQVTLGGGVEVRTGAAWGVAVVGSEMGEVTGTAPAGGSTTAG